MKELVTIATAFLIVVALAFYMYIGNQKHTSEVLKYHEINEIVKKGNEELKQEIDSLKNHIEVVDSIYHKQ